jgi:hypothetical protein
MVVTGLMARRQAPTGDAGGGGGLGRMLDANGDGNPLDDILRAAGKMGR